jgi:hypothetical protein
MPGSGTRTILEPDHYEEHLLLEDTTPEIAPILALPLVGRRAEGYRRP